MQSIMQLFAANTKGVVQAAVTTDGSGTALAVPNVTGPLNVLIPFGTITASVSATLTFQQSDDNSTWTNVDNDTFAITTAANSTNLFVAQLPRFKGQYVRATWSSYTGGGSIAVQALIAVYQPTHDSSFDGFVAGPAAS
jgi:hypothetical protein